jgi:hypothetical protein
LLLEPTRSAAILSASPCNNRPARPSSEAPEGRAAASRSPCLRRRERQHSGEVFWGSRLSLRFCVDKTLVALANAARKRDSRRGTAPDRPRSDAASVYTSQRTEEIHGGVFETVALANFRCRRDHAQNAGSSLLDLCAVAVSGCALPFREWETGCALNGDTSGSFPRGHPRMGLQL